MSDDMKRHDLTITNGAWIALWQMVVRNKWAKGEKQLRRAMRFRRHLAPVKIDAPDAVSDEWLDQPFTLSLDERDRETAKLAMGAHIEAGMIDASDAIEKLMFELGFATKEDD